MKKIALVGNLLSISGYGAHAKYIYESLYQIKLDNPTKYSLFLVPLENLGDNIIQHQDLTRKYPDDVHVIVPDAESFINALPEFDVAILCCDPVSGFQIKSMVKAKQYVLATALTEVSKHPTSWFEKLNTFDAIQLQSKFLQAIIENSDDHPLKKSVLDKTKVVYHAFGDRLSFAKKDEEFYQHLTTTLPLEKYVFVTGDLSLVNPFLERKNTVLTVFETLEAIKDDPTTGVFAKFNFRNSSKSAFKEVKKILDQTLKTHYPHLIPFKDKIKFTTDFITDSQMMTIFKHEKIHCMATLTHTEGFGMHLFDAVYNNLPVIATNYSAHTEFLSGLPKDYFYPVDYDLVDVPKNWLKSYMCPGAQWAQPSLPSFQNQLKACLSKKASFRYKKTSPQYLDMYNKTHTVSGWISILQSLENKNG